MSIIAAILIGLVLAVWVQTGIMRCCARVPGLRPHRQVLIAIAILWCCTVVVKKTFEDRIFTPPDAADHEEVGRLIAEILATGGYSEAMQYFGLGNSGFRFLLGSFYAITDAPEVCVLALYGALAFMGMLSVLEVTCRHWGHADTVPLWLVIMSCAVPSALFYCTTNLKEGLVLWGSSMMLRYTLRFRPNQPRESLLLPVVGLLLTGFLRVHIAAAWVVAMSIGGIASRRKASGAIVAVIGLIAAQSVVQMYRPDLAQKIMDGGITETMNGFYENNSVRYGGSSITYSGGQPTLVVSGMILLFLRPLPGDVTDVASTAAGLEVWCLSGVIFFGWLRNRNRVQCAANPFTVTLITAALIFSFYFTYMYNMGLMVRQRTQVLPVLVGLAAVPAICYRRRQLTASNANAPQRRPRFTAATAHPPLRTP